MITASAPGKVVLSGEYAVLAGAPALVAAVNRRASCSAAAAAGATWRFTSSGFDGSARHSLEHLLAGELVHHDDPAYLCQHVLHALVRLGADMSVLPHALAWRLDSAPFYHAGTKLGLGSSAAITVAFGCALAALSRCTIDVPAALFAAHARSQGGHGSGLDVATSLHGGLMRFRRRDNGRDIATVELSRDVSFVFVSTGTPASTPSQLAQFAAWTRGGVPAPLAALCSAAERVAAMVQDGVSFVRELRAYVSCLIALDTVAGLGIVTPPHRALLHLAQLTGVVYKPCGAGGGDLGMAFTDRPGGLAAFITRAHHAGFAPLPLELDQDGVQVSHQT